jgi:hypothetical protein
MNGEPEKESEPPKKFYASWRQPLAGAVTIAIACFDLWYMGNKGFSTSVDELLLFTGIALLAGIQVSHPGTQGKAAALKPPKDPELK